jgi:(p)ppGpp synthase/HD superfamily hydrolase
VHDGQLRKGTTIPYLSHLLAVAALVAEDGGSPVELAAALLHDAAEDHGGRPRLEKIRRRFGRDVATMVEDCTDTFESEKPAWRPRKEAYIAALPSKGPRSLLVSAADKLDNARAIVADLRADGPGTLDRFNGKRATVWYFQELVRVFRERNLGPIASELDAAVREMATLATRRTARPRAR